MQSDELQIPPWESLAEGLGFSNADEEYWWTVFGQPLNKLMDWADYSTSEKYRVLAFIHRYVIPTCGPRPKPNGDQYWDTFMGFDHTPIQVSINFYNSKATVRTGNIPISEASGTTEDPINQKASLDTIASQRHLVPGHNLRLFKHFTDAFFIPNEEANILNAELENRTIAMQAVQCMLSYDFPYRQIQTKVAICPMWKSMQVKRPMGDLMISSIKDLGIDAADYMKSLKVIEDFINSEKAVQSGAYAIFFAFDTMLTDDYQRTRVKIYFATQSTAFNNMVDIFTLGGRLDGPEMQRATKELRKLWMSTMAIPDGLRDDETLPKSPLPCAGVIFNFEIWPGADKPNPKIYLPCAYYGKDDLDIADGMDSFFKDQGWSKSFHSYKDNYIKAFVKDGKVMCRHHDISFSYKGQGAYITAYYKPELSEYADPSVWAPKLFKA
uniref:Indole diterpene prenyltransferase paxD n=1 Tax=Penicillium paxilli TaxID=70109 RepID=PAXD_PENPX|nr:RecName: Full=Indole diterpene prenyltransferase paxD; AltName: Full=Paxilline synthesis protein D [Penicillium paxilli]AAK11526.2 PaxD [Penicillium paxilli]